jgi:hypothetical protein
MTTTADVVRAGETTMIVTDETIAVMIGAAIGAAVIAMVAMVIVMVIREIGVMTDGKSETKTSGGTGTTETGEVGEVTSALSMKAATVSAAEAEAANRAAVGMMTGTCGIGPVPMIMTGGLLRKVRPHTTKTVR